MIAVVVALTASLSFAADQPAKAKKTAVPAAKKAEAEPEAAKAPRLTIVEPVKDYGTIAKGEKLDWSFLVKNTGDTDLQIIAAKPGCGCTVADFDKVIKPGETGKVTAHVDTTAFAGPIAKTVTLETNDPTTPTSQLTIHAVVKPYVEAFPAGFVRFNLLQGDADTQSVMLYSEEDEPFQVTKVELPVDPATNEPVKWVKTTYEKVAEADKAPNVGRPGQDQYKVNITVGGADARIGALADKVHIYTNSKHQPDYFVSISGVIRPTFRVEPSMLNFGEVTPNDVSATRMVMLHSNNLKAPESFVVSKAESSVPAIVTSVKPSANKGEYEVTLQIAKDAKPGDVDGAVTIYTNDKVNPVVKVPMKATIKAATPAAAASK
ncbi:MAG: DUF1573 domain-containing protein [Acidobacteria bacterium]|nr:DUF1573 domain-containing protein [Acidobacteriota bacterium]MBV9069172.1 DUF1573 domain-containing protein [Acidobacteriota bacterium]MBV9184636.1 DUF1573 domain-containing protein [Acidobacteriota bacterium]